MTLIRSILFSVVDQLPDLANILLGVVGVLMSFPKLAERVEENSRVRKTVAAVCILVGLGAYSVSGHQRHQFNLDMKSLLVNTKTSVDRTGDLMTSTNTIVNRSETTLAKLNENLKTATGGDSFCYAELIGISDVGGNLVIISHGKYPLYDVQVRVFDEKRARETKNFQGSDILSKPIGNLGANVALPFGPLPFSSVGDRQELNFFFSGRNGFWTEVMRLRKVDGGWTRATIVSGSLDERFPKGTVMRREVDKKFPIQELTKDGDWKNVDKLPKAY
jgi:hypothetical protein